METEKLSIIDKNAIIGKNVIIEPFCVILGNSIIEENAIIKSYSKISNSYIYGGAVIDSSQIDSSVIGKNAIIGPYSKIIKNSFVGENANIGNFVEVKNSIIGKGTKAKHLAYIGDAEIGDNCNVGCGVIFANYNGKKKDKIFVGNNVFIGSGSTLIAPLKIEKNCYICAGTTLTVNLKENSFVIARSRETIKEQRAKFYLKNYENQ